MYTYIHTSGRNNWSVITLEESVLIMAIAMLKTLLQSDSRLVISTPAYIHTHTNTYTHTHTDCPKFPQIFRRKDINFVKMVRFGKSRSLSVYFTIYLHSKYIY